jgi:hypothetical protein
MKTVAIHNGDEQKTVAALKKAAGKATGKARGILQGLAKALTHNPAARGRKAKGVASMAKKRTAKRATAKRRAASNPTTTKRHHYTRRSNPTGFASKVKGLDLPGILMEGAGVAAGSLANSFANRQAARILPDMSPTLRTGLTTVAATAALAYFGGAKGFVRNMAVGCAAQGITQMASSLAPGLFAGVDEFEPVGEIGGWNPDGTWNEELGTYDEEPMEGVIFDRTQPAPVQRSF